MSLAWPDVIVGAIVLIAALKGYKRGFISELAGAIALFASLITPFWYNGFADAALEGYVHLGPGSAHVVGMFLTGLATYAVIMMIAWILNRFAKLPFLGLGNALAGGAVGLLKATVFLAFALWIALFFPLS
ncbi:MAG: CvpA family protein, partial [Candidatus Eremiobacteraeota bacterium]|nr:CvpA family protein [Candidatus Eremiobacteraeota bacterium]